MRTFVGCKVYGFAGSVAALAEIWSLVAVSWDRAQAINDPLDTSTRLRKSQVPV